MSLYGHMTYRLYCRIYRKLGVAFIAGQLNCANRSTRHILRFTSLLQIDISQSKLVFTLHLNATVLLYFYLIMYSLLTNNTVLYLMISVQAGITVFSVFSGFTNLFILYYTLLYSILYNILSPIW